MVDDVVLLERWDEGDSPPGFLAGLNADDDAELELVHCDMDSIQRYYDHVDGTVLTLDGVQASALAKEVCTDVASGGGRPNLAKAWWCFAPVLFLFFLALRSDRRAARSREDVPTGF